MLLLLSLVAPACNKDKGQSPEKGSPPTQSASRPSTKVSFEFADKSSYGVEKLQLTGAALLDVSGSDDEGYDYYLRVFNDGAHASCDTELGIRHPPGGDGFAFEVRGKGDAFGKPNALKDVGFTMRYISPRDKTPTNSGGSVEELKVKITKFENDVAIGEIGGTLGDAERKVGGSFVARICNKPEKSAR